MAGRLILPLQYSRATPPGLATNAHPTLESKPYPTTRPPARSFRPRPTLPGGPNRPGPACQAIGRERHAATSTIEPPWPACPLQAPTPAGSALTIPSAVWRSASGSSRSVPSAWSSSLRTARWLSRSNLPGPERPSLQGSTDCGGLVRDAASWPGAIRPFLGFRLHLGSDSPEGSHHPKNSRSTHGWPGELP